MFGFFSRQGGDDCKPLHHNIIMVSFFVCLKNNFEMVEDEKISTFFRTSHKKELNAHLKHTYDRVVGRPIILAHHFWVNWV